MENAGSTSAGTLAQARTTKIKQAKRSYSAFGSGQFIFIQPKYNTIQEYIQQKNCTLFECQCIQHGSANWGHFMNVVEGLNVINDPKCNKVLNVITCCPKCNKVLNVITCCPEWNKVLNVIIFCPKCNKLLSCKLR